MAVDLLRREVYYNNGGNQAYSSTAPAGVQYVVIRAYGAGGGGLHNVISPVQVGGAGGYVYAQCALNSGQTMTITPGGGGGMGQQGIGAGGGGYTQVFTPSGTVWAAGGGGASADSWGGAVGSVGSPSTGSGGNPGLNGSSGLGATTLAGGSGGNASGGINGTNGGTLAGGSGGGPNGLANNGGFNGGGSGGLQTTSGASMTLQTCAAGGGGGGGYYGGGGGASAYPNKRNDIYGGSGGGGCSYAAGNFTSLIYDGARTYGTVEFFDNNYGSDSLNLYNVVNPPFLVSYDTVLINGDGTYNYGTIIDPSVLNPTYTTAGTDPNYGMPTYSPLAGKAIYYDPTLGIFYAAADNNLYASGLQISYTNINGGSLTSTLAALRVSQGGTATVAGGPGAAVIEYYGTTPPLPPPPTPPVVYDPTGYYGGVKPTLVVLGGDGQASVAGQYNLQPFDVAVWNAAGSAPLVGAPVQFSVDSGGGLLASSASGGGASSLALVTDVDGTAMAYYQQPATSGIFSLIHVRAGASQYVFTTSSYGASAVYPDADGDGIPDAAEISLGTNSTTPAQIVPASTLNLSVYTP